MTEPAAAATVYRPSAPVAVGAVLGVFRRGGGDPTWRSSPSQWWLGWQTPQGPVTLHLEVTAAVTQGIRAQAWGAGADWMIEHVPALLGAHDDPAGFVAHHPLVAHEWRRFPAWRVPRSGLVAQTMIPAVIEQKVTGQEAFAAYRRLVRRHGAPAPGPGAALGLITPPTAAQWATIPSWEWLMAKVDIGRSRPAVTVAQRGSRLDQLVSLPAAEARSRMESLPGIGRWTSAEVAQRALGDADAVSFGDYHVARNIGWALTGQELDDDGLAELLEPYAGHRYRVQRLLELGGHQRPRHGARMAPRTHLPRG